MAGEEPERDINEPHPGFYKTKEPVRNARRERIGSRWVDVYIDLKQEICPETGELLSDETLICFVGERSLDPVACWPYLTPITEREHNALSRNRDAIRKVTDLSKDIIT